MGSNFGWSEFKSRLSKSVGTDIEQDIFKHTSRQFDPLNDVPTTQEEVYAALRYGRDDLVGNCLIGIFECEIGMGNNLLDAYKKALLAYLGIEGGD